MIRWPYLQFIFLATVLTLSKPHGYAQDLHYTHYTVESGLLLPSNEVFGIVFDKEDVLWATTGRGIWRYDGYEARQFSVHDGLKENANLRIFHNQDGSIWVSSLNNYLYQIIGDSVRRHPCCETIKSYSNPKDFIQQVVQNPDSSIFLCFNRPGLTRFKSGEKPIKVEDHRRNHEGASVAIHYRPDQFYWDMIGFSVKDPDLKTSVTSENGWVYITCGLLDPKNNFRKDLCPIGENEFIFSYSNKVFHIKDGQKQGEKTFEHDVLDVFADRQGNFWVGLEDAGALCFLRGDFNSVPVHHLKEECITCIKQDHEGNYWFSTNNNGIFQANTLDIAVYKIPSDNAKDNVFVSMVSDGQSLYLGTQTGMIIKAEEQDNKSYKLKEIEIPFKKGAIRKLYYTPEKHLLIFNDNLLEVDTLGRYTGIKRIESYPFGYLRQKDRHWLVSYTNSIKVFKGNREVLLVDSSYVANSYPKQEELKKAISRMRNMIEDSDGRLWMGSQNSGLYSYLNTEVLYWNQIDSLFGKRTLSIEEAGENIWVSIADHGLAMIRPDSTFIRITQKDGLSSDIIDVLYAENEEVIWAGTNNGLNRITLKKGSQKADSIAYYTMSEGLPSNRIYQIIKHKGEIWIATTLGAIRMNPEFSKPLDIRPRLVDGALVVNDKPMELLPEIVLGPDENNLVFKFKAITYRKSSRFLYRYKLIGADKDYILTRSLESRYPGLSQGKYTFSINASYNGVFDDSTEKSYTITIKKHWYETNIMWVFYALLLSGLVFGIFRMILMMTKTREREKQQLLKAEKKSLLSQMNPHFIFNSLNSIQHFIIQHDEFQANNYLTNFSGLIRRILDNSKKNVIPLNEEITTLSLYLGMEKLRFENEFEYQIIKDPRIDYTETLIPPMLLQPFVENAIWHGLLPLKAKGTLKISFTQHGDFFQCTIEDNGIGREKAQLLKSKRMAHISTGILNVQERIELLNKTNKKKIHLLITDLKEPNGTASGTLVELFLPIDLKI
jgi:streptogramin lyase